MNSSENILLNTKLRPTAMRILIFSFLRKHRQALTITDIESKFQKVSRSTVLRTIKTFEKKGLIHAIIDDSKYLKYALNDPNQPEHQNHLHLNCLSCNHTYCMYNYTLPQISIPPRYHVKTTQILVKGICDICQIK